MSSGSKCTCGACGCCDGVVGTVSATAGPREGLAKDNDGRGDRERAGVEVENVDSCVAYAASRLVRGIDKSSSDDLVAISFRTRAPIGIHAHTIWTRQIILCRSNP
jgi:hypothetical protein